MPSRHADDAIMDFAMQDVRPRHFQADLDRLYRRVIVPALHEMPVDMPLRAIFPAQSLDGFLERAEHETDGLLAREVRRGFALTIAAVFERQLSICMIASPGASKSPGFVERMHLVAAQYEVDLEDLQVGRTIERLHLIANVVRHGDGRSLSRLREFHDLWQPGHLESTPTAETMVISDSLFRVTMLALTRFWGLADREPLAVVDAPY